MVRPIETACVGPGAVLADEVEEADEETLDCSVTTVLM